MKLKELFKKHYDLLKEEYQTMCDRLPIAREEERKEEKRLREEGFDYTDIYFNKNYCASTLNNIISEINEILKEQPILIDKLNKINEILNNDESIISLKRNELEKFSKGKIILEVGTNAIGDSNSNIKGKLSGGIDGSSFLGFGSVNGSITGSLNGTSNAHYEEYILVKYKYNLDYEIEEFLFNIDDYLESKGE